MGPPRLLRAEVRQAGRQGVKRNRGVGQTGREVKACVGLGVQSSVSLASACDMAVWLAERMAAEVAQSLTVGLCGFPQHV